MSPNQLFRPFGATTAIRRNDRRSDIAWRCFLRCSLSIHIIASAFTHTASVSAQFSVYRPTYVRQHPSRYATTAVVAATSTNPQLVSSNMVNDSSATTRPSLADYLEQRDALVARHRGTGFESDAPALDAREQLANAVIMAAKNAILAAGHANPHTFPPSQSYFESQDAIRASKLFKIVRRMPKAGILHAHDTALASVDFLVSLTYRDDLWQTVDATSGQIVGFKFARTAPAAHWTRTADERRARGAAAFDPYVRRHFTLRTENPRTAYADINAVWVKFMSLFILVEPLVTYAPVWRDYYRQSLKEALEDNVQYVEFRGLLPALYDLDGGAYSKVDSVQMYVDVLAEFKRENPTFIGSKFIYAPLKAVPNSTFEEYVAIMKELQSRFPEFIAGFDLVGQEDTGRTLLSFAELILQLPEDIKFFFHAGETNWYGSVDENMIDAILLGTHRIGHGFALAKHPELMQLAKERDIAIEINPLSNQVLKLVDDMRNHPASIYMANNVPLVVSSDDPCFWEATSLSDDFYQAFLGIASSHSDLRTLKKLATNSIRYSAMSAAEKKEATAKWLAKWSVFIEEVIADQF